MRRTTIILTAFAFCVLACLVAWPSGAIRAAERRPMELADILAWKNIGAATISTDGQWFAHRLTPLDGDSEVVVRQTRGDKEYRFQVGELRGGGGRAGGPGGAGGADLAFSHDAKWVAFVVAPGKKEAAQLRRQRRPVQNKVALVDLASGSETRFEKIRSFSFSGEKATWIALHRYGADAPAGPSAASSAPTGGGAAAGAATERPRGSDLILHELATGTDLNVGNVSAFAFDKRGRWLAWTIDAQDQVGNGLALRDMDSGAVLSLDSGKAVYERLTWTEKGDGLSVLKGTEDKRYTDKVYAVVGFTGFAGAAPQKVVYDPAKDTAFPAGMAISPNRSATWTEDLAAIFLGIREPKKAEMKPGEKPGEKPAEAPGGKPAPTPGEPPQPARPADAAADEEKPDLVIWHHLDTRLQSQQQVQETSDRNFSYLSIFRVKDNKFIRLADDDVRSVTPAPKGRWAIGTDNSKYELMGNMDGRRFQDVYVVDLETGARRLALEKARWVMGASTDGSRFLYYNDGHFYTWDMASGRSTNLTKAIPTSFINLRDDHNVVNPPVSNPVEWTKDGDAVLLSDDWDIWLVPMSGGAATNLTVNGKKEGIRYGRRLRLDPEERGIDLSIPNYFSAAGDSTKKTGIVRLNPGRTGVEVLAWDAAMFRSVMKAAKADVYLHTRETNEQPPDYYVADESLKGGQKLTAFDRQVENFAWSAGSQLLEYTVTLGKGGKPQKLQASLFLPANYEKGKTYPMLVYIYERLTQNHNGFTAPTANGFNKSVYTSNGYAVLMPDITYKLNDPGMSAVWCVVPAVQAAVKTGIVDPGRVGIQGHSWGGYQTAFLVTQTNVFAAAVAGAPLTNMVSMYSLIYKNTGGTNQAIFESSQGRFLGGYLDNWEAYVRNSPVNFAKNVRTPLMLLHNDRDGAVDFTQGVEYYNTLRRLGKNVVMLEYTGENHGLAKPANQQDYTVRMKEFFDHHLMGKPAPDWYTRGVPRLEMEEHLKQRAEERKKAGK